MNRGLSLAVLLMLIVATNDAVAQHCAPIVESYLSAIQTQRTKSGIDVTCRYEKTGGQPKAAYQTYLVAYADSKESRIAKVTPQQALGDGLAVVLDTQLAHRTKAGNYEVRWHLDSTKLVQLLLKKKLIGEDRIVDHGSEVRYDEQIRLAVFIPFLDDQKFSVLEGLPEDRHECNYRAESALLFESLPTRIDVRVTRRSEDEPAEREYALIVNGRRPSGPAPR